MHVVELAVLETPQDVLRSVGAPAEVGGVPAEEVLLPVRQQLGIIGRAPAADDRVALEVDVDAAGGRFGEELLVRGHRVRVYAGDGRGRGGRVTQHAIRPGNEVAPVRTIR